MDHSQPAPSILSTPRLRCTRCAGPSGPRKRDALWIRRATDCHPSIHQRRNCQKAKSNPPMGRLARHKRHRNRQHAGPSVLNSVGTSGCSAADRSRLAAEIRRFRTPRVLRRDRRANKALWAAYGSSGVTPTAGNGSSSRGIIHLPQRQVARRWSGWPDNRPQEAQQEMTRSFRPKPSRLILPSIPQGTGCPLQARTKSILPRSFEMSKRSPINGPFRTVDT